MPSADQLKALLRSHLEGDEAQFLSVAMQVAAHEARQGHGKLAGELRDLIDRAKTRPRSGTAQPVPLVRPKGEMAELLSAGYPKQRLADMVLAPETARRLKRLVTEHTRVQKLRAYGLAPRKKLLLVGPPGSGKTLTASVLAGELGLPLFVVRLDGLMTKFMGETAAKLRLIFDSIRDVRGVYLFDEFDSIGSSRSLGNDVGEIRRVLNSFLQLIEQDDSDSLLVAATNHADLLDHALFRRFDDVIEYHLPAAEEAVALLKAKLATVKLGRIHWVELGQQAAGLSHGDLTRTCAEAIKEMLIHDGERLTHATLKHALEERRDFYQR